MHLLVCMLLEWMGGNLHFQHTFSNERIQIQFGYTKFSLVSFRKNKCTLDSFVSLSSRRCGTLLKLIRMFINRYFLEFNETWNCAEMAGICMETLPKINFACYNRTSKSQCKRDYKSQFKYGWGLVS